MYWSKTQLFNFWALMRQSFSESLNFQALGFLGSNLKRRLKPCSSARRAAVSGPRGPSEADAPGWVLPFSGVPFDRVPLKASTQIPNTQPLHFLGSQNRKVEPFISVAYWASKVPFNRVPLKGSVTLYLDGHWVMFKLFAFCTWSIFGPSFSNIQPLNFLGSYGVQQGLGVL